MVLSVSMGVLSLRHSAGRMASRASRGGGNASGGRAQAADCLHVCGALSGQRIAVCPDGGRVAAVHRRVSAARRRVKRGVLLALVCAGGLWTAQPALADVDMTGNFVGFTDVFVPVAGCTFDFVQSGTVLSITGDCEPHIGPFNLTG